MCVYVSAAVIEHVRDGCTVRAFLLPSFQYITVMLSGIKVCQPLSAFWHDLCRNVFGYISIVIYFPDQFIFCSHSAFFCCWLGDRRAFELL